MKTLFHDNGVYLWFNDLRAALWSACDLAPLWNTTEWRGLFDCTLSTNEYEKLNLRIERLSFAPRNTKAQPGLRTPKASAERKKIFTIDSAYSFDEDRFSHILRNSIQLSFKNLFINNFVTRSDGEIRIPLRSSYT